MKKKSKFVRFLKTLLAIVLAVVFLAAAAFLVLAFMEYKPKDVEAVDVASNNTRQVQAGQSLTIVSFNTGYAALGEESDFFMDGGKTSRPDSREVIFKNLEGIADTLVGQEADIYLLQEVDISSKRSFNVNEVEYYCISAQAVALPKCNMFAYNFKSVYVPIPVPIFNDIGKVQSGLATFTDYNVGSAERIQLPVPFSWPVRCFNLKRCLLVSRMPVEGTDKELVVVNLHLEAYDDGEGKIEQTKMLYEFLAAEYAKGNYVIAGGDFNQTFPGAHEYPALTEGCWMPGTLDPNLPEGFSVVYAEGDNPTCRLLDVPYKGNDNPQYYIIDGSIVSANIKVDSVNVIDRQFKYSDHQAVRLEITLGE